MTAGSPDYLTRLLTEIARREAHAHALSLTPGTLNWLDNEQCLKNARARLRAVNSLKGHLPPT